MKGSRCGTYLSNTFGSIHTHGHMLACLLVCGRGLVPSPPPPQKKTSCIRSNLHLANRMFFFEGVRGEKVVFAPER